MSDVRSEFEAWAVGFNLTAGMGQDYWSSRTQGSWLAWQAATKRVPMTDEQIQGVGHDVGPPGYGFLIAFARAIEAHHNIKGEQT